MGDVITRATEFQGFYHIPKVPSSTPIVIFVKSNLISKKKYRLLSVNVSTTV